MITVGLDREKYRSNAKRLERLFMGKTAKLRAEVERKSQVVAADTAFALLSAEMPSERSGIGKAIKNISRDFKNGLLTEGEAFEIIAREASRRQALAFYAKFKQGNMAGAQAILRSSQCSISGYKVGSPEQIDTSIIATFKSRIIAKTDLERLLKKEVIPRLGFTASGWAACMEKLGHGGNVIRWKGTAIHGSGGGQVHQVHDKNKVTIFLANTRPLARKLINPSTVRAIMQSRREWLARWLQER